MSDDLSPRPVWRAPAPVPPAPPEPDYEPVHPGSGRGDWRERLKRWVVPIGAAGIALATKLKALLLILPKIKILSTSATMLVSIAAYALIWSWKFAIGFVLLLLIHEMGHVWQLRREGIQASAPMFIPFLGAVVMAKSMGKDAAAEARVGLAGPVLGTIGTLIPLVIWLATGEEFWQALTYVGFFLNLFNLLPVLPLDGGRAMAALSQWVWFIGFAGLVALTFVFPNPILILILLLGGYESYRRWKSRHSPESQAFHAIPKRTRAIVAIVYLGLVALLALGVYETHLEKTFADA
jgi:Zn-dependent protease